MTRHDSHDFGGPPPIPPRAALRRPGLRGIDRREMMRVVRRVAAPMAGLVLAHLILGGCQRKTEVIDYDNPSRRVDSVKLMMAFQNHPVTANRDYTGQVIEVTGQALRVEKDGIAMGADAFGDHIWCVFESDSALRQIQIGQEITVVGLCKGQNGHLLVDRCRQVGDKS